uniref:Uncharacterized protein n=1 Tax=Molossus molossus TaxID=27622 RepID=A0A7J8DTE7_MOLMO|nr:hypothetical protein HJG59_009187 [Molossus molossus]
MAANSWVTALGIFLPVVWSLAAVASVFQQRVQYFGNVLFLHIRIVECHPRLTVSILVLFPFVSQVWGRGQQRVSQGFAVCLSWWSVLGRRDLQACKTGATCWDLCFTLFLQRCLPHPCSQLLFMAVVFIGQFANDHLGSLLKCRFLSSPTRCSNSLALGGAWKAAFFFAKQLRWVHCPGKY